MRPCALAPRMEPVLPNGWCNCPDPFAEEACGCGEGHRARAYRDHVVHLGGSHWRVECAFDALLLVREGLEIVAGEPDRNGRTHGSVLHDMGRVASFASAVLAGKEPLVALDAMAGGAERET